VVVEAPTCSLAGARITILKTMKPKKFVIVSDIHGSMMDERACKAALSFTKDFKPDVKVIAGDLWDFSAIRKGASEDEKQLSMRDDFDAGATFANSFFSGGGEKHLMLGNHDVRAHDLRFSPCAVKKDLGMMMVRDINQVAHRNNAKIWDYDARTGVLDLGHLRVVHGFHTGMSACAAHSRIYGNVVFGHIHSIESFQTPGLEQREARSIGCLCSLNPDYANRKTGKLRWSHGWGFGWLFSDGTYQINQARNVEGDFYAPTEIKKY
jgi:predicted phosphodiesterase